MILTRRKLLVCASAGIAMPYVASAGSLSLLGAGKPPAAGGGGGGGFSLISHTAQASTNTNGFTTATGIDTTGANFIIVAMMWYIPGGVPAVSDNKSNGAPTALTGFANSQDGVKFFYWYNPSTVGSGHTFTCTGTANYPTMFVAAFSGATASPFDSEIIGSTAAGTSTASASSLTPGANNELLVSVVAAANAGTGFSVNSGFSAPLDTITGAAGYEGGLAYLHQTTGPSSVNPTWSWTTSTRAATNTAAFKFSA